MVQTLGGVQISYGVATVKGLTNAKKKYDIPRLPGTNNDPRPPICKLITDIIRSNKE